MFKQTLEAKAMAPSYITWHGNPKNFHLQNRTQDNEKEAAGSWRVQNN